MKIQEVLDKTTKFFREKAIDSARLDAELLLSSALGIRRIDLYLKFDQPLAEAELEKCRTLVKRRSQGEPVAYILGHKEFFGFDFVVDANVLIPRPETETLVEIALEFLQPLADPCFADLGSGSGCIGISILKRNEQARGFLVENSPEAVELIKKNAGILNVIDRAEVKLMRAQEFQATELDLVVANPPYIAPGDLQVEENVRKFEPSAALFAEENGTQQIREWAKQASQCLRSGGRAMFEIGANQAEVAKNIFADAGFQNIQIKRDLSDRDRIVVGTQP